MDIDPPSRDGAPVRPARKAPAPATFYSAETYLAEQSVGHLLHCLVNSISQAADRRFEALGLTNAQWKPLLKLHAGRATTVAEVARECLADAGAMTRLLDRLEAKGLIKRVRSTVDRRVVNLELTPEGVQAAEQIPAVLSEVQNEHLAGFAKSEWQLLKTYLGRMLDNGQAAQQRVAGAAPADVAGTDADDAPTDASPTA